MAKTSLAIAPDPRVTALKTRATKLLKSWQAVEVTDTPSFESAGEALKQIVAVRKDLKELLYTPEYDKAKAEVKAVEKLYKDIEKVLKVPEDALRDALEAYDTRQKEAQSKLVEKALEKGQDTKAAAIAARPFTPSVSNLSFTEHWHAEVTDKHSLLQAVLDGKVSSEAVTENLVYLNVCARAEKEKLAIPGVKAVKETSSSVRT